MIRLSRLYFFFLHLNIAQYCSNNVIIFMCFNFFGLISFWLLCYYYAKTLIYMFIASSLQNPQRLRWLKHHRRRHQRQDLENANINRIDKLVISVTLFPLVTTRISQNTIRNTLFYPYYEASHNEAYFKPTRNMFCFIIINVLRKLYDYLFKKLFSHSFVHKKYYFDELFKLMQ